MAEIVPLETRVIENETSDLQCGLQSILITAIGLQLMVLNEHFDTSKLATIFMWSAWSSVNVYCKSA